MFWRPPTLPLHVTNSGQLRGGDSWYSPSDGSCTSYHSGGGGGASQMGHRRPKLSRLPGGGELIGARRLSRIRTAQFTVLDGPEKGQNLLLPPLLLLLQQVHVVSSGRRFPALDVRMTDKNLGSRGGVEARCGGAGGVRQQIGLGGEQWAHGDWTAKTIGQKIVFFKKNKNSLYIFFLLYQTKNFPKFL